MRDYAKVSPQFWTRGSGKRLRGDADAQILALYLVTCPSANMIGIYYVPFVAIAHETGLGEARATSALVRLRASGFADYDEDGELAWVPNMASYQVGETISRGDKRHKGILAELHKHGSHPFCDRFLERYSVPFSIPAKGLARGLEGASCQEEGPSKGIPRIREDQDQDQDQDQEQIPERGGARVPALSADQEQPKPDSKPYLERATPEARTSPLASPHTPHATLAAPEPSEPVLGHPDAEAEPRTDRGVQDNEWRSWGDMWIINYQASVRKARGLPDWTAPAYESGALKQALASFCRGPNSRTNLVSGWIADSVTRFVEATRDKSAFFGEHGPRGFLKWLNSGGLGVPAKPTRVVQREAKPGDASPELPNIHPARKTLDNLHMAVMQKGARWETLGDVPVPTIELSGNPATAPAPSELQEAYRRLEAYDAALAEFEANREKEIEARREMPPPNDFFEPSEEEKAKFLEEFNAGIEARRIDWKAVEANGGQIPLSPEARARQLQKVLGVSSIRADVERKGLTPQIIESAKDMVASFARLGGTPPEDIVAWSKETL